LVSHLLQSVPHEANLSSFIKLFTQFVLTWESKLSRTEIIDALLPIRKLAAASPFVKRAQCWPRGYAGDFETIRYILEGGNWAVPGTLGYYIEDFFLTSSICEQHHNKIIQQGIMIKETVQRKRKAHILSIGCGTSEDLYSCLPHLKSSGAWVTLVDIDGDALAYSLEKLVSIKERVNVIKGNIYKEVRQLKSCFDLILIGGVFDYLPDKVISVLLKQLGQQLQSGGQLFFTNIARGNPFRICMEYLADWVLIERGREELEGLIKAAVPQLHYTIQKDSTGLTYLATLQQPAGDKFKVSV
jgi:extracellular factor (EF) 3-hydroxypalmitic acid methyl ester biosynthesis protein